MNIDTLDDKGIFKMLDALGSINAKPSISINISQGNNLLIVLLIVVIIYLLYNKNNDIKNNIQYIPKRETFISYIPRNSNRLRYIDTRS